MAQNDTLPTLADAFRDIADRVTAAPSVDLGRKYPQVRVDVYVQADTVEDVTVAAIANGTRIFRDGVRTYTDINNAAVNLRFFYTPASEDRLLARPVDVTDELAGRDA